MDCVKFRKVKMKLIGLLICVILIDIGNSCKSIEKIRLTSERGIIQSPGFPNPFPIPFCVHWIIDSLNPYYRADPDYTNGRTIHIYLSQVYLKENLTFIHYLRYPYGTDMIHNYENNSIRSQSTFYDSGYSPIPEGGNEVSAWTTTAKVLGTGLRFFGIHVEITSPHPVHFRAKNFFNVYGFNITYEITNTSVPLGNLRGCTLRNCSSAGNCLLSSDYKRFFCDCLPGRFGEHCEYSDDCDPTRNITFCQNGGTCSTLASGFGVCFCPPGYTGGYCAIKLETSIVKECPGPNCERKCGDVEVEEGPCSCHNGKTIPRGPGWIRYEVKVQAADITLPDYNFRTQPKSHDQQLLKNKTKIENSILKKLNGLAEFNSTDMSVTVVSFGPASTISFQFFASNESTSNISQLHSRLQNILFNGSIHPIGKLSNTFNLNFYPALTVRKLIRSRANELLKVGDAFDLTCVAEGSPSLTFKWFKETIPINPSYATRIIQEKPHSSERNFLSTSILMFRESSAADRGVFTCQVTDMGEETESVCMNITLTVVAPPLIQMEPISLTLNKDEYNTILICSCENESLRHNFSYSWEKDGQIIQNRGHGTNEIIEGLDPYGSILRIIKTMQSATFTCIVSNIAGESRSVDVEVIVLVSQYLTFCRQEWDQFGLIWSPTGVRHVAKTSCHPDYVGFAQRPCNLTDNGHPKWGQTCFSKCIPRTLRELSRDLLTLKMGFGNSRMLLGITQRLVKFLENRTMLYPGESDNIITLWQDIGNYAILKKHMIDTTEDKFLRTFFKIGDVFLQLPGAGSSERTMVNVSNLIQKVTTYFPSVENPFNWTSEVFLIEKLQLTSVSFLDVFKFPISKINWINFIIQIPNSVRRSGHSSTKVNEGTQIVFIAYRNLSSILVPSTSSAGLHLQSPIISISSPNFTLNYDDSIKIQFNVTSIIANQIQNSLQNLTCTGMELHASRDQDTSLWTQNACSVKAGTLINNQTLECHCHHFGQYGLMSFDVIQVTEVTSSNLHWSVILGTIILIGGCLFTIICIVIHIEFQLSSESLYSLKLVICSTLIFSHLLILSLRNEAYSIPLSTSLCTMIILLLACQVTSLVTTLIAEEQIMILCSYIRSISPMTLLLGFIILTSLPTWITSLVIAHSPKEFKKSKEKDELIPSVLREDSAVFSVFVLTISLVLLLYLYLALKTNSCLRRLRNKINPEKNHILSYRLKILNRSIFITGISLMMSVTGILVINYPHLILHQYAYGLSITVTGLVIPLLLTIKSEYPIPQKWNSCLYFLNKGYPEGPDPEKRTFPQIELNRAAINGRHGERILENGHLTRIRTPIATIANLQLAPEHRQRTTTFDSINSNQISEAETTIETIGGSSLLSTTSSGGHHDSSITRTCSMSTKRPSLASFNVCVPMSRSFTNPAHSFSSTSSCRPLLSFSQGCSSGCCRKSRTQRSSSCAGSCSTQIKPQRGRCLIRDIAVADYVLPSASKLENDESNFTQPLLPKLSDSIQLPNETNETASNLIVPTRSGNQDLCPGYVDFQRSTSTVSSQSFHHSFLLPNGRMEAVYETIPSRSSSINDLTQINNGNTIPRDNSKIQKLFLQMNTSSSIASASLANNLTDGRFHFKKMDPLPPPPQSPTQVNLETKRNEAMSSSIVDESVSDRLDEDIYQLRESNSRK